MTTSTRAYWPSRRRWSARISQPLGAIRSASAARPQREKPLGVSVGRELRRSVGLPSHVLDRLRVGRCVRELTTRREVTRARLAAAARGPARATSSGAAARQSVGCPAAACGARNAPADERPDQIRACSRRATAAETTSRIVGVRSVRDRGRQDAGCAATCLLAGISARWSGRTT